MHGKDCRFWNQKRQQGSVIAIGNPGTRWTCNRRLRSHSSRHRHRRQGNCPFSRHRRNFHLSSRRHHHPGNQQDRQGNRLNDNNSCRRRRGTTTDWKNSSTSLSVRSESGRYTRNRGNRASARGRRSHRCGLSKPHRSRNIGSRKQIATARALRLVAHRPP